MSRFIHHRDMTAEQVVKCVIQARALIGMCHRAMWADVQNENIASGEVSQAAEDIQFTLQLAQELLDPVQDAMEEHEGWKGGVA